MEQKSKKSDLYSGTKSYLVNSKKWPVKSKWSSALKVKTVENQEMFSYPSKLHAESAV
jgi:hypothetical protein